MFTDTCKSSTEDIQNSSLVLSKILKDFCWVYSIASDLTAAHKCLFQTKPIYRY